MVRVTKHSKKVTILHDREVGFVCVCVCVCVCLFAISWATPVAYGGSQARGLMGAVATGLRQSHSNARS